MFFYVVSRTYAEFFSLLRICSGLLSNSPGLNSQECAYTVIVCFYCNIAIL